MKSVKLAAKKKKRLIVRHWSCCPPICSCWWGWTHNTHAQYSVFQLYTTPVRVAFSKDYWKVYKLHTSCNDPHFPSLVLMLHSHAHKQGRTGDLMTATGLVPKLSASMDFTLLRPLHVPVDGGKMMQVRQNENQHWLRNVHMKQTCPVCVNTCRTTRKVLLSLMNCRSRSSASRCQESKPLIVTPWKKEEFCDPGPLQHMNINQQMPHRWKDIWRDR